MLLDLQLKGAEDLVLYVGSVAVADVPYAISVEVSADLKAADGLGSVASACELPDGRRRSIERLAASMARKAVRGARKDGMPPPRRIRRWRSIRG